MGSRSRRGVEVETGGAQLGERHQKDYSPSRTKSATAFGRQGPSSNDVGTPLQSEWAVGGRVQDARPRRVIEVGIRQACLSGRGLTCGAAIDLNLQAAQRTRSTNDGQRRDGRWRASMARMGGEVLYVYMRGLDRDGRRVRDAAGCLLARS